MSRPKKRVLNCDKLRRCARILELREENTNLRKQLEESKRQVDDLRRSLYGKKKKSVSVPKEFKKKGAPFGHKGATRAKPEHIDEEIEVIPKICPYCGSQELSLTSITPEEHIQEDIVLPKRKVTRYIKMVCECKRCKRLVRGKGQDEMTASFIGPVGKAIANYLRYNIGIPQHKIKQIFKELFDLPFVQASVAGFENQLTTKAEPIYNEMMPVLKQMRLLHIDETGWKKDGLPFWLWCYSNHLLIFYHIDKTRGSKVIESVLGEVFKGIIITDFLSAYNSIRSLKQKCLPHVLRMIERYWQDEPGIKDFCEELKELMKRIIYLFKQRNNIPDYCLHRAEVIAEVRRLLSRPISHKRTDKWRNKLKNHQDELYTCLFHPKSDFNNNFVERMLRPSVIMRKITYGNRSDRGLKNHSVIMSVLQTAKLHNKYVPEVFHTILTNPSQISLADIIIAPGPSPPSANNLPNRIKNFLFRKGLPERIPAGEVLSTANG